MPTKSSIFKNMKVHKIILLSIGTALLSSCDSSTPLSNQIQTNADRAKALDVPVRGDTLSFTSTNGDTNIGQLVFDANGISNVGDGTAFYTYRKLSDYSFSLTLEGNFSIDVKFPLIVENLLGSNSSLAAEFRTLIVNRLRPDFTPAEVTRLKAILNPAGADLSGDTVDELFVTFGRQYTNIVTSTEGNKILGTIGGVYQLDANSAKLSFRPPNAAEISRFRFLSPASQIPFVTGIIQKVDNLENGTWVSELVNSIGN